MATDPVCGMKVDEGSDYQSVVDGKAYYFCSFECKEKFDANPIKYSR